MKKYTQDESILLKVVKVEFIFCFQTNIHIYVICLEHVHDPPHLVAYNFVWETDGTCAKFANKSVILYQLRDMYF